MCFANSAVLTLFGLGKTTGTVVDVGHGTTSITPVMNGEALLHSITKVNLAGQDVTDQLDQLLHTHHGDQLGGRLHTSAERDLIREMKEKICFVKHGRGVQGNHTDSDFELPDGITIKLRNIQHEAPEVLFHPERFHRSCLSIPDALVSAIQKCDMSRRHHVAQSTIITGGTSKMD